MIDEHLTSSIDKHPVLWWILTAVTVVAMVAAAIVAIDATLAIEATGAPRLPQAGA